MKRLTRTFLLPTACLGLSACTGADLDSSFQEAPAPVERDDLFRRTLDAKGSQSSIEAYVAAIRETLADEGCAEEDVLTKTRMIGERESLTGSAQGSYRAVISVECADDSGTKKSNQMLLSTSVTPGEPSTSGSLMEMMAFQDMSQEGDSSKGVFNFYRGSQHVGNSIDAINGTSACGDCHTGGGLIMKELDSPWLNWEHSQPLPGVRAAFNEASEWLGSRADGDEMEQLVKGHHDSGNQVGSNPAWNEARIDHFLETGNALRLFEPLFCSTEVNLDNVGSSSISSLPVEFYADPMLLKDGPNGFVSGSIRLTDSNYQAVLEEDDLDQTVPMDRSKRDSHFKFPFMERAFVDMEYVHSLVERGIIDLELARDVLLVDFTRPLVSHDRCGLVGLMADLDMSEVSLLTTEKIGVLDEDALADLRASVQAAVRSHLEGAVETATSGPAAMLADNLAVDGRHDVVVDAFEEACTARITLSDDEKEKTEDEDEAGIIAERQKVFLRQAIVMADVLRERGRHTNPGTPLVGDARSQIDGVRRIDPFGAFEHASWLPEVGISAAEQAAILGAPDMEAARFDPTTCEVTSSFVASPTEVEEVEEEPRDGSRPRPE